jgi:hypothetical protein
VLGTKVEFIGPTSGLLFPSPSGCVPVPSAFEKL